MLSTDTPLTLTSGKFNNTFHFGNNGSLDPVQGNVTINAKAGGSDELILDDSSDADRAFALYRSPLIRSPTGEIAPAEPNEGLLGLRSIAYMG